MRSLNVSNTEVDLSAQDAPFLPGYTVTVVNATATSETLQEAATSGGSFTTLAVVAAGQSAEVTLNEGFIRLADAGNLILLGK